MTPPRNWRPWQTLGLPIVCAALIASAALASGSVSAQEAGHPAHIHLGTCADLGEIEYPLSDVGPGSVREGTLRSGGQTVGATEGTFPVDISSTTIDAPLSEITDGNHAINVHESADNIQNYIACGNIGGTQFGNTLVIGLGQLNDSGYSGVAVLRANDDQTVVTVYLGEGLQGESATEATPTSEAATTPEPTVAAPTPEARATETEATAPAGDGTATESAVEIRGFAFGPADLTIPAGTTVTWTNFDSANHTVTADDGAFDSGPIANGETFSFTFDTPGTYTYHCAIHPSMTATITVT